jgi:hypothetical protein
MTTGARRRFRRWPGQATVAALIAAVLGLGGCSALFPSRHKANHPDQPLSDRQSIEQVLGPAKEIAKVAMLQGVSGNFRWESCNDQGIKPYRGRLDMTFAVPRGADRDGYFQRIAYTMEANGWSAGPPPGRHASGTVIHQDEVMATIGMSPYLRADGAVQLSGQCRNVNDHRRDSGFSVDDELGGG